MKKQNTYSNKKIWIDLDNSPHVPFFRPIIEELNKRGYEIMLTARECFQVNNLVQLFNLSHRLIGRHYGKNKILKLVGTFIRAIQLSTVVFKEKPDIALSHGSRAQLLLATILGIPSVLCMDYEHAKFPPLMRPKWIIASELISKTDMENIAREIRRYPGIKEDIYVSNFKPIPFNLKELGNCENKILVTIRPPAIEAHYHNSKSEKLFEAVIEFLSNNKEICMILLPRNKRQNQFIKKKWFNLINVGKIIIPEKVLNGLNLIWYSDLVISGGGTMNREAAALKIPVYSIFKGKIGAVDKYLIENGRLTIIDNIKDIHTKIKLTRHKPSVKFMPMNHESLKVIVNEIIQLMKE